LNSLNGFLKTKFVSDSILTIISHFFVGISGLIINSIVGVNFLANGLGIFSQGLSIYLLISLLANFGIHTSAQKHASQFAESKEKLKTIFVSALIATGLISVMITGMFYLFLSFKPFLFKSLEITNFVKNICFAIPLFALNKTLNSFMVGLRRMQIYAAVRATRWLFIVLGIIVLVSIDQPLQTIPFLFIITELFLFLYLVITCRLYWGGLNTLFIKTHITFGVKNIMAGFVGEFVTRTPILIIGYMSGNEAAGHFAYVLTFARSILMIPAAIQRSFNPVFTKLWYEPNIEKININISKVFKVCLLTLIPIFTGLYCLFWAYTYFVMPVEYLQLHWILFVLLIGMSTTYVYGPFSTLLIMTGHLYSNLIRVSIFAFINLSLMLLLISDYGNMGVAYAITISMILNLVILDYFYAKILNIQLFKITLFKKF